MEAEQISNPAPIEFCDDAKTGDAAQNHLQQNAAGSRIEIGKGWPRRYDKDKEEQKRQAPQRPIFRLLNVTEIPPKTTRFCTRPRLLWLLVYLIQPTCPR